jgi:hypothetical protein
VLDVLNTIADWVGFSVLGIAGVDFGVSTYLVSSKASVLRICWKANPSPRPVTHVVPSLGGKTEE